MTPPSTLSWLPLPRRQRTTQADWNQCVSPDTDRGIGCTDVRHDPRASPDGHRRHAALLGGPRPQSRTPRQ